MYIFIFYWLNIPSERIINHFHKQNIKMNRKRLKVEYVLDEKIYMMKELIKFLGKESTSLICIHIWKLIIIDHRIKFSHLQIN